MQWVLLLALSNGGVAILDADNQQHCEEIRANFQQENSAINGLPQYHAATNGIEWTVCTVRSL